MYRWCFFITFASYVIFVWGLPLIKIQSNDEEIGIQGDNIRCGALLCPAKSATCIYQKRTNKHNPSLVDVMRQCVDHNGVTTAESFGQFEAMPGQYYNTIVKSAFPSLSNVITVSETGSESLSNVLTVNELTPEQEQEIKEKAIQVNQNVKNTVNHALQNLNRQLKNLDYYIRHSQLNPSKDIHIITLK